MSMSIRKKYNIPKEAKVLLYVGNISRNKNQIQMVKAYSLLPDELKNQTYVLFCGEVNSKDSEIEKVIASNPDAGHMILCGSVDKDKMPDYYRETNGVVLLSITEGFGLSLIEGMHYGKPCMMFSDMDAFSDIYDDNAVIAIPNRQNEIVANCLIQLLSKKWNQEDIVKLSQKFTMDSMAHNYIGVYQTIING